MINGCSLQVYRAFFVRPENRASVTVRLAFWAGLIPAKVVTKRSVRVVGRGLASYPLAPPRPEEKKAHAGAGPNSGRIQNYQLSNMASPDVVCQPCGSALGAPTKECSTAHKTLFLPRNWQSGSAHE